MEADSSIKYPHELERPVSKAELMFNRLLENILQFKALLYSSSALRTLLVKTYVMIRNFL